MSKTVLITGAAQGIGKAIALELAEQGFNIIINYLNSKDKALELENLIKEEYQSEALAVRADVSKENEVDLMFSLIEEKFGGVDILINNAAIDLSNLFHLKNADEFRKTLDVNVVGAYNCAIRAYRHMHETDYGRIINISSSSCRGNVGQANYSASKAGVNALTQTAALERGLKRGKLK